MKSNFFGALIAKKQTDSKESFGTKVYNAVIKAKDEKDKELNSVFDAINSFKDGEKKDNIIAVVKDAFENKEKLKGNEEEFKKTIDAMYLSMCECSVEEMTKMCTSAKDSECKEEGKKEEDSADKEEDSEDKEEDSEDKEEGKKEEDSEDKEEGKKEEGKKEEGTKDSSPLSKEDILKLIAENLAPLVKDSVKEVLGIKDSKGYGGMPAGSGESTVDISEYDYSKFI